MPIILANLDTNTFDPTLRPQVVDIFRAGHPASGHGGDGTFQTRARGKIAAMARTFQARPATHGPYRRFPANSSSPSRSAAQPFPVRALPKACSVGKQSGAEPPSHGIPAGSRRSALRFCTADAEQK